LRWDIPGTGRRFSELMEARRLGELEQEFKPLRRAWCLGSEQFRQQMLRYVEAQRGRWHCGVELRESAEAKAERLIAEALQKHGLIAHHLLGLRKSHPFKLLLAAKLRAETTVTVDWIARRLNMGTRGHLATLLWQMNARKQGDVDELKL
jgi:hypothetical protein